MPSRIPRKSLTTALAAVCLLSLVSCIYRIDIQQGNLLDADTIEQVKVGMTRSQVRFLLGTPTVSDSFHQERWDYPYYLRRGRSKNIQRRWLAVYFDDDRVVRLEKSLDLQPAIS